MIEFAFPEVPFNPVTIPVDGRPLTAEWMPGPGGLIAFALFIPLTRLVAKKSPFIALTLFPMLWLLGTLGPVWFVLFTTAVLAGAGWITTLSRLRQADKLSQRSMITLVWIGLHLLILPLWWKATWPFFGPVEWLPESHEFSWANSRLAIFHSIGMAYILLRLIAWGTDEARNPSTDFQWKETILWLFYPPALRNGPFMLRGQFLERYASWNPSAPVNWGKVLKHTGYVMLGGAGLGAMISLTPTVTTEGQDFFAMPKLFKTSELITVFYVVPTTVYFMLWTYNHLAQAYATWIGIEVDPNFHNLPLSTSVKEFWRRWNTTVGLWIRDYIYIPLGGNRRLGLLTFGLAFMYCGIWHGAAWSYLVWPLIPIASLSIGRYWHTIKKARGWDQNPPNKAQVFASWLLTMHVGLLTVFVFADFEHCGFRLLRELFVRLTN